MELAASFNIRLFIGRVFWRSLGINERQYLDGQAQQAVVQQSFADKIGITQDKAKYLSEAIKQVAKDYQINKGPKPSADFQAAHVTKLIKEKVEILSH